MQLDAWPIMQACHWPMHALAAVHNLHLPYLELDRAAEFAQRFCNLRTVRSPSAAAATSLL
jgi:hypothetical protein